MDLFIESLTKEYDGKAVVHIEGAQISGAGCIAIIGPNGAGKSTLLNLIAGLDTPTSGYIQYGDKENRGVPYQDLTLVFQKPYLLSTTVEKNISYPLKLRKWDNNRIEERVSQLLHELGLADFRQRKSWKLSGGETQKVALARALSFRPKILLLDEPTANIDPATTKEIEDLLRKVSIEEGIKVILVTHNLAQVKRLSTQTIFMHNGAIIEQGLSNDILADPKSPLTRGFIEGELLI